jgi:hypothetical protein
VVEGDDADTVGLVVAERGDSVVLGDGEEPTLRFVGGKVAQETGVVGEGTSEVVGVDAVLGDPIFRFRSGVGGNVAQETGVTVGLGVRGNVAQETDLGECLCVGETVREALGVGGDGESLGVGVREGGGNVFGVR